METIVVTVSEIVTLQDNFQIEGTEIPEGFRSYELNEWDEYALEEAVQYSEDRDDVEVVTVTVGPGRAEETVRTALAKGADRAIRVWDETLDETDLFPSGTAAILAAVVEDIDPSFVLTGVQSGDDAFGATGVILADMLGYEWAAVVNSLDVDGDAATVHRELEGGTDAVATVDLPAVFTIQTGINEPRYASLRGIRQAQQKEIAVTSLEDVGVDESEVTTPASVTAVREPESEGEAEVFEGDADETAAQLVDLLAEQEVGEA